MRYRVQAGAFSHQVDVLVTHEGEVRVSVDDEPVEADVYRVPDGMHIRIGGRGYDIAASGPMEATQVAFGARRALAAVDAGRRKAGGRDRNIGGAQSEVRAPMPGRVVKVLVEPGQAVQPGQACVVVEAMKMENELTAPRAGTIESLHVEVGASVEPNALLVRLRSE